MTLVLWLLTVLLVTAPGALLRWRSDTPEDGLDRVISGAVLGLATVVLVAFFSARVDMRLTPVALVLLAGAVAFAVLRRPSVPASVDRTAAALLGAVLVAVFVSRWLPTTRHTFPPGWDPSFHLLLARKVQLAHALVTDWRPFEDIALNYPLGSHVLLAALSDATGLELHVVFKLLFPTLGALTTAQVFVLARRATGVVQVGLYAAMAYGAWTLYGSIDYYRWGGLPSLLGMSLALEALTVLVGGWSTPRAWLHFAVSFAGAVVVHHHVMLTMGLVFLACAAVLWRRDRPRSRWLLLALVATGVLAAPQLVPYALRVLSLGDTRVLSYDEEVFTPWRIVLLLGPLLVAFAGAGLLVARSARRPDPVVLVTLLTLVGLYALFGHAWRYGTRWLTGSEHVAFTPSRFVTDLAYVLPVYAGLGLHAALQRVWPRFGASLTPTAHGAVVVAGLALGAVHLDAWEALSRPTVPAPMHAAYAWIAEHTPPETLVLNNEPWTAYATWRRAARTPIPVSEPEVRGTPKDALVRAIVSGQPPESAASLPRVAIRPVATAKARGWAVLWEGPDGVAVIDAAALR